MSKFVPVEGISKRPKRASRACDHCRWKRLKCSDEQKGESCMNCVIYGTKCQYTPPWSPNSGRKKDSASKIAGVKKRSSNRNSTSPVALDSQDSPTSSYNEDMFLTDQNMLPKMAQARRLAAEFTKATDPNADLDQIGSRLDQYAAFLTNFSENRNSPAEILSDETGLPSQAITNALLQAYSEGFEAGSLSSHEKFRPLQLSSQRRSRSMHEFTPPSQSPHDVSLSSLALDTINVAHHHHSNLHHHHSASLSPHSPMSPFAMDAHAHNHHLPVSTGGATSILGGADFGMQMHASQSGGGLVEGGHAVHGAQHHAAQHHRPTSSRQRSMQNGLGGTAGQQPTPRSVPHGLSLAIPGDEAAHWGGPNSAPPAMMPQGFGGDPFNMM